MKSYGNALLGIVLDGSVHANCLVFRQHHVLAGLASRLYVYGGISIGLVLDDIWELDLANLVWNDLTQVEGGPNPGKRHSMGSAVLNGVIYFFSGFVRQFESPNDLRTFNPSTRQWAEVTTSGSGPRGGWGQSMVAAGASIFVFGGFSNSSVQDNMEIRNLRLNSFFRLDMVTMNWTDLSLEIRRGLNIPPFNLAYAPMVADSRDLFLLGNQGLYVISQRTGEARMVTGQLDTIFPLARVGSGLVEARGSLWTFGGLSQIYSDTGVKTVGAVGGLLALDIRPDHVGWKKGSTVRGPEPSRRWLHGLASADGGQYLYVFGGTGENGEGQPVSLDDFHRVDIDLMEWTNLTSENTSRGTAPGPRAGLGLAEANGRLFMFGGCLQALITGRSGHMGDFYVFDPLSDQPMWTNLSESCVGSLPAPRCQHGFASSGGRLFVLAGSGSNGPLDDLHRYSLESNTWKDLTGLLTGVPIQKRFSMGFAAPSTTSNDNRHLYVYGGNGISELFGDLLRIDLDTLEVRDLTPDIAGPYTPGGRYGVNLAVAGGRAWIFSGLDFKCAPPLFKPYILLRLFHEKQALIESFRGGSAAYTGPNGELFFTWLPREHRWPAGGGAGGFLDLYDWDTVVVDSGSEDSLLESVDLCEGVLPCSLLMVGHGAARLRRAARGRIVCLNSSGCQSLSLQGVELWCDETDAEGLSSIEAQGSILRLINVSMSGCRVLGDGAAVRAYASARVVVNGSRFRSLRSAGYGGAVSAVGSRLLVVDSVFEHCHSLSGGGAVWVSTQVCYGEAQVQGATVEVHAAKFINCTSRGPGGAILASSAATNSLQTAAMLQVSLSSCTFERCSSASQGGGMAADGAQTVVGMVNSSMVVVWSDAFGGGVAVTGGGRLVVSSSLFLNVTAAGGGGAIWASAPSASLVASVQTTLEVLATNFRDCFSSGGGGALLATSLSESLDGSGVRANVSGSTFQRCRSGSAGGAVSFTGSTTVAEVALSKFDSCTSETEGGAMAALSQAWVALSESRLQGNVASGRGGGAIFVREAHLELENCRADGNRAPSGGGGVLFWDGGLLSRVDVVPVMLVCGPENWAVYGTCTASSFRTLVVSGIPTLDNPPHPGLSFLVSLAKKDIYGQTILSDSSSLVEAVITRGSALGIPVARLVAGQANMSLALSPLYEGIDVTAGLALLAPGGPLSLLFRGIDAEDTEHLVTMTSQKAEILPPNGTSVCPRGFVLVLDSTGLGACSLCEAGTYSINPLFGLTKVQASCLLCPLGAQCTGGDNIEFSRGMWVSNSAFYRLVSCPEDYALVNSLNGAFNQGVQQCSPCPAGQINLNPNSSEFTCYAFAFPSYARVLARLPMSQGQFDVLSRLHLVTALAAEVQVPIARVLVSILADQGRRSSSKGTTQVECRIGADNTSAAAELTLQLDVVTVRRVIADAQLPAPSEVSVSTVSSGGNSVNDNGSWAAGAAVASLTAFVILAVSSFWAMQFVRRHISYKAMVVVLQDCKAGDTATLQHLPLALRNAYVPSRVVGRGAYSCVIQAKTKASGTEVAVKLLLPSRGVFEEHEVRQLRREQSALALLTSSRCEHGVHLAGSNAGVAHIEPQVAWFVMEYLSGEDLERTESFTDAEVIQVSRAVLAALKVLHAQGLVHRDVKPANIMVCKNPRQINTAQRCGNSLNYMLIDMGSVLGVDESLAKAEMMTITDRGQMGAGTPPYMSPEMFYDPAGAKYPTDLWSLGVTMFKLATGHLPFQASSDLMWSTAIAGDMGAPAPSVFDVMDEDRRSMFDGNLARVIARALEKNVKTRFATADEMHEVVYNCLVSKGEAFYSVFISYRVASEAPLARIIFDELNHSVTPGGHRVTVYWDAYRLVKGEAWEAGFMTGLLNSLCFLPLLSYGSTAPLAALANEATAAADGWDARPVGVDRLRGDATDREDNVLKELLIARALLERVLVGKPAVGEHGMIQVAYPILVGRPHPPGHPRYPGMGDFFRVQAGGGRYPSAPSPATGRAVVSVLLAQGGLPALAVQEAVQCGVAATVASFTRLQACLLWNHEAGLMEIELTKEQEELVGKGSVGPPVDLDGTGLTPDQRAACLGGYDRTQLRMLKAQVRAKRGDILEIIDRAVDAHRRAFSQPDATKIDLDVAGDGGCGSGSDGGNALKAEVGGCGESDEALIEATKEKGGHPPGWHPGYESLPAVGEKASAVDAGPAGLACDVVWAGPAPKTLSIP